MGAWGPGNLENDDAQDWLSEFCLDYDVSLIEEAVGCIDYADEDAYLEIPECSTALAACEVLAALAGHPSPDFPEEALLNIGGRYVDRSVFYRAKLAALRIRARSELQEVWTESDWGDWERNIGDLLERLSPRTL